MIFGDCINQQLKSLITNFDVKIVGEDVGGQYGGAFKITKNFFKDHPENIINFPISEAGICAWSLGMSMANKPVVMEVMFSDFSSLIYDLVINHASKFEYMYNEQVKVPLLIRMPNGAGRGYGATHSQNMEKFFVGIPGIDVFAVDRYTPNLDKIYGSFIRNNRPTLIFESKTDYSKKYNPNLPLSYNGNDGTLIGFGTSSSKVLDAAEKLVQSGFEPNVTLINNLNNMDELKSAVISIKKFALIVDDNYVNYSISDQLKSIAYQLKLNKSIYCLSGPSHAIPSSRDLEKKCYPNIENIFEVFISGFKNEID